MWRSYPSLNHGEKKKFPHQCSTLFGPIRDFTTLGKVLTTEGLAAFEAECLTFGHSPDSRRSPSLYLEGAGCHIGLSGIPLRWQSVLCRELHYVFPKGFLYLPNVEVRKARPAMQCKEPPCFVFATKASEERLQSLLCMSMNSIAPPSFLGSAPQR